MHLVGAEPERVSHRVVELDDLQRRRLLRGGARGGASLAPVRDPGLDARDEARDGVRERVRLGERLDVVRGNPRLPRRRRGGGGGAGATTSARRRLRRRRSPARPPAPGPKAEERAQDVVVGGGGIGGGIVAAVRAALLGRHGGHVELVVVHGRAEARDGVRVRLERGARGAHHDALEVAKRPASPARAVLRLVHVERLVRGGDDRVVVVILRERERRLVRVRRGTHRARRDGAAPTRRGRGPRGATATPRAGGGGERPRPARLGAAAEAARIADPRARGFCDALTRRGAGAPLRRAVASSRRISASRLAFSRQATTGAVQSLPAPFRTRGMAALRYLAAGTAAVRLPRPRRPRPPRSRRRLLARPPVGTSTCHHYERGDLSSTTATRVFPVRLTRASPPPPSLHDRPRARITPPRRGACIRRSPRSRPRRRPSTPSARR